MCGRGLRREVQDVAPERRAPRSEAIAKGSRTRLRRRGRLHACPGLEIGSSRQSSPERSAWRRLCVHVPLRRLLVLMIGERRSRGGIGRTWRVKYMRSRWLNIGGWRGFSTEAAAWCLFDGEPPA